MSPVPPIVARVATPDYRREFTLSWGGVDWDAVAWYDVVSTPERETLTDPPAYLEIDVWRVVLSHWYGGNSDQALPPGVHIEPDTLPPDTLARIVEDCVQDWHDCHSPKAHADDAADAARDARHDREP